MQGRTTVYNNIVTPEDLKAINKKNIELSEDFLDYLSSVDRSKTTIHAYKNDLEIFFTWNLKENDNIYFVELTKRQIAKFQNYALNTLNWSPNRLRRVKSTLSSLSNYIENILDDEIKDYRPIVRKIENPPKEPVREKTIFTPEQLQQLIDELVEKEKFDQACMLSMAMHNGRRKAELPRMKTSYFTENNLIYGSLYRTPEKVVTKGRGSNGKMLTIYTLKNGFQPYLDLWMKYREEHGITSQWLIPKHEGDEWLDEQLPMTTMDSWATNYSKMLGVPFYWHSLRHFFCTECSKSGLPDDVIRQLVGWTSQDMVILYKDTTIEDNLCEYFDENGIKETEQKSLSDM